MLKCKIQIVPRTVGSEATNTIKLFVDNNSGSDTSAVCHETMDTAADTACHRLPKSTGTTFAQIFPIISANCRFIVGEINKPICFGLYLWKKQTKQKLSLFALSLFVWCAQAHGSR